MELEPSVEAIYLQCVPCAGYCAACALMCSLRLHGANVISVRVDYTTEYPLGTASI